MEKYIEINDLIIILLITIAVTSLLSILIYKRTNRRKSIRRFIEGHLIWQKDGNNRRLLLSGDVPNKMKEDIVINLPNDKRISLVLNKDINNINLTKDNVIFKKSNRKMIEGGSNTEEVVIDNILEVYVNCELYEELKALGANVK